MATPLSPRDQPGDQLGLLFHAPPAQAPQEPAPRRIWTVAALVAEVRGHLERSFVDCWVEGEIASLRSAASGHLYFTLKDDDGQLPVVLFRRQAILLRFRPEAGLQVLVRGRLSVYEERGQLQMIAETLEPVGAGSLQFAFEQLKQRLQHEGLFDAVRKRPLPPYPRCIGIVTSASGAVIRDFLNIAGRRHAGLDVLLYPATVQGDQAAAEVAAGILYFNQARTVDAIVIARGGGSAEDLAAFNTELLARAIAASELPVVSAVGHETDFTIADFVADLRAPTPSAAAELLTAMQHGVEERVEAWSLRLLRACRYTMELARGRFAALSTEATVARMRSRLDRAQQRVDEQQFRLAAAWQRICGERSVTLQRLHNRLMQQSSQQSLAQRRHALAATGERLGRAMHTRLLAAQRRTDTQTSSLLLRSPAHRCQRLQQQIEHLETRSTRAIAARFASLRAIGSALDGRLAALSPLAVLERGYSLSYTNAGALLRDSSIVTAGDGLKTRLAHGVVFSKVVRTDNA